MTTPPKLKKQITYSGAMDIQGNDEQEFDYSVDTSSSPHHHHHHHHHNTESSASFNRTNSFTIPEEHHHSELASSPSNTNNNHHQRNKNQNDINSDINSMHANTDTKCYVLHRTKEIENLADEERHQQEQQQQDNSTTSMLSSSPSSHLRRTAEVENLNELE